MNAWRGTQRARDFFCICATWTFETFMKFNNKWLLTMMASAVLAACGGGSSETVTETFSPASQLAAQPEVKYSSGCFVFLPNLAGPISPYTAAFAPSPWRTTVITVQGSLSDPSAIVSAEIRDYLDAACTKQSQRVYAKGVATFSADTKSLTDNTGALTKVGRKGQLKIDDFSLAGISLSASPAGAVVNFVVVDEGDKLYFAKGSSGADGYPFVLSATPAFKQP
jgi:hypothetical protein